MDKILGVFAYIAFGMLFYMLLIPFSWEDPWLYIFMALWPFIMIVIIGVMALLGAIIFYIISGILFLIKAISNQLNG